MKSSLQSLAFIIPLAFGIGCLAPLHAGLSVADYVSIQEAIDKNPGKMIEVPVGDHRISASINIRADDTGLFGYGRIVQDNPTAAILTIENASNVRICDLTLTRAGGKTETSSSGIVAARCTNLVLQNVRVLENRSPCPAIKVDLCKNARVLNCSVENYMRISVDDRTASDHYGYAFNVIDGTGINADSCVGTLLQGNSVVERELIPTPELKEKYKLGQFCKKNPVKGSIISQKTWDEAYANNWHQGAAICVTNPEVSEHIQILGNYIENAAQGIDIHADHVIISQNIITNAFMGMKAMHGSRNVIITGNQFIRNDIWAIGLMPGTASHAAVDGKPETANADGGSIIANNIISDFGHGSSHWIWGNENSPFVFNSGQEPDDPPLTDVIIQGNVVHNTGTPLYKFAVLVADGPNAPRGLHFSNNVFHPGTAGVCNVELNP